MPLHPPCWKPFKEHGVHFQSNTSLSETKRRRAFKFDSMSRFCGVYTWRKNIVSYVSVLSIDHFDVYGGHFTKWRPLPWIMLFISATTLDSTTIAIYSCIFYRVAELRKKLLRFAQNRCAHHAWGVCLKMEDLPLSIIILSRNFEMYALQGTYRYLFMVNISFKIRTWI